jgi:hypothetical protein
MARQQHAGIRYPASVDPDPDAQVLWTYREVWERLPEHIRDSFHPEWPWLDPPALMQRRPRSELAEEIANLRAGDAQFLND